MNWKKDAISILAPYFVDPHISQGIYIFLPVNFSFVRRADQFMQQYRFRGFILKSALSAALIGAFMQLRNTR